MRYFLEFAYLGTAYHGWQRQPNAVTVQEVLEDRMATLLRADRLEVTAAGRTDTGVHARKMVAHFDWGGPLPEEFLYRLNAFLPGDIAVRNVVRVAEDAHARFDALSRTYSYHVIRDKDPFRMGFAYRVYAPLDIRAMNRAASLLLEFEDFKCFSRSNTDVKTYICDIREAFWTPGDGGCTFTITADRFLRNMVRAVVGTLLRVGKGELAEEDVKTIIKSRDRSEAGASVPAKGLYLADIVYPQRIYTYGEGNR